jgi:hypothetical protein
MNRDDAISDLSKERIGMSLDAEMRNEMDRLETEVAQIDEEIKKLQTKMVNLINIKKKKEHDLRVLKLNFNESIDEREIQLDLAQLLKAIK